MRRNKEIETFLNKHGWSGDFRTPLADDASFRRYERLNDGIRNAVLMDAPPKYEEITPFVFVANHLRMLGLSAPKVYEEDISKGLLLLEDFGDDTYSRILDRQPGSELQLYKLAIEALLFLQTRPISNLLHPRMASYTLEVFWALRMVPCF